MNAPTEGWRPTLERLHKAVKALGSLEDGDAALRAWQELDAAQKQASALLDLAASPPAPAGAVEPGAGPTLRTTEREREIWREFADQSEEPADLRRLLDDIDTLLAALASARRENEELRERAERAEQDRDRAQSACTAWQIVFEGIDAHLSDRINMRDPADPATYREIIRADVARVHRDSVSIVNARWADSARYQEGVEAAEFRADRLERERDEAVEALEIAYRYLAAHNKAQHDMDGFGGIGPDGFPVSRFVPRSSDEDMAAVELVMHDIRARAAITKIEPVPSPDTTE